MQLMTIPLPNISESDVHVIYEELGVNLNKIEHNLKLIKEWLKYEQYLPSNVDEDLLINFLMKCKGNLEKTKDKFEKFLIARTQMPLFFTDRCIEYTFDPYMTHRTICVSKKLTPNGNRVVIIRFPSPDSTHLDELRACKYFVLLFEVLLYHDKCAGYHFVFDAKNANMQIIGKINLGVQKNFLQLIYFILPFRLRSILILNGNVAFDVFVNIAKIFMSKKLKERIFNVKEEELLQHFPSECLPADYGGTEQTCDELCEQWLKTLKSNKKWCRETEELKLVGPLPEKMKNLYSFEDFNMVGSFRKLQLD